MINGISFVLSLVSWSAGQDFGDRGTGVTAGRGTVVAVQRDALEIDVDADRSGDGRRLKLKITKATRLEQADVQLVDGKLTPTTKPIKLTDLGPEQSISVIIFNDGKELTLLRAVATSGEPGGKELARHVQKLGGKMKRRNIERLEGQKWIKGRVVYEVDLDGTQTSDDDLLLFAHMKGLDQLNLSFTRVTDRGIAHLADAPDLGGLELVGTKVTDKAIEHLRRIRKLRSINLAQTAITDEGLERLVRGQSCTVCKAGLGAKARFRVHQNFVEGKLDYNYLMINDTHFGMYQVGDRTPLDGVPRDRRRQATTYYHRYGPVGQVMAKLEWFKSASVLDYPSDVRMPASLAGLLAATGSLPTAALAGLWSEPALGVVRLNVGTHAAYARAFQHVHFYNSTPEIRAFSLPADDRPPYFGYIQDAMKRGCAITVVDGDERHSLTKKGPKKFYSALFVEAARNDLRDINTELMTREAIAEMMNSLTETGVLCLHTSHRYHDLVPPIIDAASSLHFAWKVGKDTGGYARGDRAHFGSEWVMVARRAEYLDHLTDAKMKDQQLDWFVPESTGKHLWRDGQPHDLAPLARSIKK